METTNSPLYFLIHWAFLFPAAPPPYWVTSELLLWHKGTVFGIGSQSCEYSLWAPKESFQCPPLSVLLWKSQTTAANSFPTGTSPVFCGRRSLAVYFLGKCSESPFSSFYYCLCSSINPWLPPLMDDCRSIHRYFPDGCLGFHGSSHSFGLCFFH